MRTKNDDAVKSAYLKQLEKAKEVEVTDAPTIESLVSDGLSIIASELSQYRRKTSKGIVLDLREARVVTSYIEALTKMSREARESNKPDLLDNLSDAELLELATKSLERKNLIPPKAE